MFDARSDIPDLSLNDLAAVYDTLQQVDDTLMATANRPNMKGRERLILFLERWADAVSWQKQDVAEAIRRTAPTSEHQRRERARVLFDNSLRCDDDEMERFVAVVNEAIPPMRDPASNGEGAR